jgi:Bacteriophage minor capsid protein
MFTSRHLVEWLTNSITSGAKVYNDTLPATGRVIYVRLQSGPGYSLEGVQDNLTFSVECRGADRNYDDAENIAWDVDRIVLTLGVVPYTFADGTYMYFMGRTGGPPTEITVADSSGRYAFTCNYYVTVATDL